MTEVKTKIWHEKRIEELEEIVKTQKAGLAFLNSQWKDQGEIIRALKKRVKKLDEENEALAKAMAKREITIRPVTQ